MFTRNDKTGWDQSTVFKKSFSVDVEIEFVGVWYARFLTYQWYFRSNTLCRDTVCSVGLVPHHLPFTHSNTAVRYFRHAISLDERRAKFKANHWHLRHEDDQKGTKLGEMPRSNQRHPHYHSSHNHHRDNKKHFEEQDSEGLKETDVREVWFAGCHCGTCNRLRHSASDFKIVAQTSVGGRSRTVHGIASPGFHFVG